MKPKLLAIVLLALSVAGLLVPILPTWLFVAYGPCYCVDAQLSVNDAKEIARSVRKAEGFAAQLRSADLGRLSLTQRLLTHKAGVLAIESLADEPCVPPDLPCDPQERFQMRVGFDCGGWCGFAHLYEAKRRDGQWVSELVGYSVD